MKFKDFVLKVASRETAVVWTSIKPHIHSWRNCCLTGMLAQWRTKTLALTNAQGSGPMPLTPMVQHGLDETTAPTTLA